MPLSFQPLPKGTMNVKTGEITGVKPLPTPKNIGIPIPLFHQQVMQLANLKTPIEKVNYAIDSHPAITDKNTAKSIAGTVYEIMNPKGDGKNS